MRIQPVLPYFLRTRLQQEPQEVVIAIDTAAKQLDGGPDLSVDAPRPAPVARVVPQEAGAGGEEPGG